YHRLLQSATLMRKALRPEARFLIVFLLVLAASFSLLAWTPVNDHVVEPFTGLVARVSGGALNLLGQHVTRNGTVLQSPRLGVNSRTACTGVEAMVIRRAAMVAFRRAGAREASAWRWARSSSRR